MNFGIEGSDRGFYYTHVLKLPSSLIKAMYDQPFDYAIGLRDGRIIRFEGADLDPSNEWVSLKGTYEYKKESSKWGIVGIPYCFDRGIDVRISDIMWCADAPEGS